MYQELYCLSKEGEGGLVEGSEGGRGDDSSLLRLLVGLNLGF